VRILIVGAGATGGYLGATLLAAGREVVFLVRPTARKRLRRFGLRICTPDGSTQTTQVTALTASELHDTFDVILIAARVADLPAALDDIAPVVGDSTAIVPVLNGTSHLAAMVDRYGTRRVYGAVATLAVSSDSDGVIHAISTGAALQIGALERAQSAAMVDIATYLDVDGLNVTTSDDIITAIWAKFGFITSMTMLTCLLRSTIGPIARTPGGREIAVTALREVTETVTASGHPLPDEVQAGLHDKLTDATSTFGPSMYRDLTSGRPVETDVLAELADHARHHQLDTPLLDTALVALMLHNSNLNK
jgi:2-dehydropantoate 2-reductase